MKRTACTAALEQLGAERTGAQAAQTPRSIAARRHVDNCPSCASVLDDNPSADDILAAIAARRPRRNRALRGALGVVAAVQCIIAIPWLFETNLLTFLSEHVAAEHLTRDGAIGLTVGVAGLVTVCAPRQALAMLVMAAATVVMQLVAFAVDESHDRVHAIFELSHVLVPIILALIAVFVLRRDPVVAEPQRRPGLRAVR